MTREDIIHMALEAGLLRSGEDWTMPLRWGVTEVERFAALVAVAERTACARIANSYGGPKEPMMVGTYEAGWFNAAEAIAADIRARGKA